eukprot:1157201-Pelagomonas_calceolata.AAC.8
MRTELGVELSRAEQLSCPVAVREDPPVRGQQQGGRPGVEVKGVPAHVRGRQVRASGLLRCACGNQD